LNFETTQHAHTFNPNSHSWFPATRTLEHNNKRWNLWLKIFTDLPISILSTVHSMQNPRSACGRAQASRDTPTHTHESASTPAPRLQQHPTAQCDSLVDGCTSPVVCERQPRTRPLPKAAPPRLYTSARTSIPIPRLHNSFPLQLRGAASAMGVAYSGASVCP
jgi:hypothetical protein